MNLSLRDLASFVKCRRPDHCGGRPALRLQVEQLEQRAVPTINLPSYTFNFPGVGTFHATSEIVSSNGVGVTATFNGVFSDAKSGINVPVKGNLFGVGQPLTTDFLSFRGGAAKGIEMETAQFAGILHEGQQLDVIIPPSLEGVLTEDYLWLISTNPQTDPHQTVRTNVTGTGRVGTGHSGMGQVGTGLMSSSVTGADLKNPVAVNPQPLPPSPAPLVILVYGPTWDLSLEPFPPV
jgi:hypothetical protein